MPTGAEGFIGSHLTEKLVAREYNVKAFVYYNSFNSWGWLDHCGPHVRDSIEIFAGDIRDPFGVDQAVDGCDIIFHLAALIAIPYSYHSPATYVDTNINGTLNILQAARKHNVQKMVHTSTSEVYGTAQFVPITEDHPLCGQSPYSASKIGAKLINFNVKTFHVFFDENLTSTLVQQVERLNIDTIYAPWVHDVHRDHQNACKAALMAGKHVPRFLMYQTNWYGADQPFRKQVFNQAIEQFFTGSLDGTSK